MFCFPELQELKCYEEFVTWQITVLTTQLSWTYTWKPTHHTLNGLWIAHVATVSVHCVNVVLSKILHEIEKIGMVN